MDDIYRCDDSIDVRRESQAEKTSFKHKQTGSWVWISILGFTNTLTLSGYNDMISTRRMNCTLLIEVSEAVEAAKEATAGHPRHGAGYDPAISHVREQ